MMTNHCDATPLLIGHGRIGTRHVYVKQDLEWFEQKEECKLKSLIEIRSERIIGQKVEKVVLYYGSSRDESPQQFAEWIGGHWKIESLHL